MHPFVATISHLNPAKKRKYLEFLQAYNCSRVRHLVLLSVSAHVSSALYALWAIILVRTTAENGGKSNRERRLSRCLNFRCLREENSIFKMRRGPGGVGAINRQRLARVTTLIFTSIVKKKRNVSRNIFQLSSNGCGFFHVLPF